MIDLKRLEESYNLARNLEKAGNIKEACEAYHATLKLDPQDHIGVTMRLAALGETLAPARAPEAYMRTLFNQNADAFDYILVHQLNYNVPFHLADLLRQLFPSREFKTMLDLGCGTGLTAEAFEEIAPHKTGVDISEKMVEIAHEKGDYDELYIGDALNFLEKSNQKWHLISATDLLPYLGNLQDFFRQINAHLEEEGCFCFSTEKLEEESSDRTLGYSVGKHYRFAHHAGYIKKCLEEQNLRLLYTEDATIRLEQGDPIIGELVIAQKMH